jgi:hypothetical protein
VQKGRPGLEVDLAIGVLRIAGLWCQKVQRGSRIAFAGKIEIDVESVYRGIRVFFQIPVRSVPSLDSCLRRLG